ncbi:DnaJ C-terminal domain-containing protein [Teichococcus aestuarii]|uniref:DnaJ C-terminal domain-containing protein n=1 Tax=Teichococcus aestuarii TaxID=568898 RepID=UPI003618B214
MAEDPYKVLGVPRDATPDAIKQAYRKLARQHHPDLNPGKPMAEVRFKEASAAHDLLSDPEQRARFDRGEIDAAGQEQRPPSSYRRHAEAAQGARYGDAAHEDTFEDLFAEIFAARRAAEAAPRRGDDATYKLAVPFLSAVQGATERLTLPDGRVLDLKIPPGVVSGSVLRLRGKGEPGRNGGPDGDALIELEVGTHPELRREGMDLHKDLSVSLRDAVLGGAVLVSTPSGTVRVTLPPHTDTGHLIRLRGKGVAAHAGHPAGDLILSIRVVIGPPDAALEAFLRDWRPAPVEKPENAPEPGAKAAP